MKFIKSLTIAAAIAFLALGFTSNVFAQQSNSKTITFMFANTSNPTFYPQSCIWLGNLFVTNKIVNQKDLYEGEPDIYLKPGWNPKMISSTTDTVTPGSTIEANFKFSANEPYCNDSGKMRTVYWCSFHTSKKYNTYYVHFNKINSQPIAVFVHDKTGNEVPVPTFGCGIR